MNSFRHTSCFSLIVLISILCSCSSIKNNENKDVEEQVKLHDVTFRITQTSNYCGGARPTDEILKELNTPKPLSNKKIFIREGEVNDIDQPILYELTSDAEGKIDTQLPVGSYNVVFSNKKDRSTFENLLQKYEKPTDNFGAIDKDCLTDYFKRPAFTFTISTNSKNDFDINYVNKCRRASVPCAVYKGPIPPSAPPKK